MERVLTSDGYTAEDFESVHHARLLLDDEAFDLAVVDEMAGSKGVLGEVVFLREHYPRLPIVVTGTLLSQPTLLTLLRLGGATEAVLKPFTPAQLRDAVVRTLARAMPRHVDAVEFAIALKTARSELSAGQLERAKAALARVHAEAPLDSEASALEGALAELQGHDGDALRAYRAAIALRDDEATPPPEPYEAIARLEAYAGARPTPRLSPEFASADVWIVPDPVHQLPNPPATDGRATMTVLSLGIADDATGIFFRQSGTRAFVLLASNLRADRLASTLAELGSGPILNTPADGMLDLDRVRVLRDKVLSGKARPTVAAAKPAEH